MANQLVVNGSKLFMYAGAAKHFVLLSYWACQPGAPRSTARRFFHSCFVVEAEGKWILITAGHVIGNVIENSGKGAEHFDFHLHDRHAGNNFEGGIPFAFEPGEWVVFDADPEGADYAATFLHDYFAAQLAKGKVEPIREHAWGTPPFEQYKQWVMVGVPDETVTTHGAAATARLILLPLAPAEAPAGMARDFRVFAQIVPNADGTPDVVQDIVGMSGGPIFGLNYGDDRDKIVIRYWVIGIQSMWKQSVRRVGFCPAICFLDALKQAAQKISQVPTSGAESSRG